MAWQVNLVGGYYDAGDHVKFGLPMAFTVTMMAWGTIEYRNHIINLSQMQQALWAIRWGTDYFLKSHTQPNVLWGQVYKIHISPTIFTYFRSNLILVLYNSKNFNKTISYLNSVEL